MESCRWQILVFCCYFIFILEQLFTGCRTQGWQLYFQRVYFHSLLVFIGGIEESHQFVLLKIVIYIFFIASNIFSFFGLCGFTMICLSLNFFLLFVILRASRIYGLVSFTTTGKFSALFKLSTPILFLFFFWDSSSMYLRASYSVLHVS